MTKGVSWWWPALLILLAIGIGIAAIYNVAGAGERDLMRAVALRDGPLDAAIVETVQWITWLGDAAQRSAIMIAFSLWLFWRRRPRAALVMIVTVPLAGVTSSILKEIYARPRPDVVPHLDLVTNFSYPSGHAVNAMTVLLLGALLMATRARGLWITLAVAGGLVIGLTRLVLGVHYPSDIVGGWLIGIAFALIGWRVAENLEPTSSPSTCDGEGDRREAVVEGHGSVLTPPSVLRPATSPSQVDGEDKNVTAPTPSEPPALSPAQSHSLLAPSDAPRPSEEAPGSPPRRA